MSDQPASLLDQIHAARDTAIANNQHALAEWITKHADEPCPAAIAQFMEMGSETYPTCGERPNRRVCKLCHRVEGGLDTPMLCQRTFTSDASHKWAPEAIRDPHADCRERERHALECMKRSCPQCNDRLAALLTPKTEGGR